MSTRTAPLNYEAFADGRTVLAVVTTTCVAAVHWFLRNLELRFAEKCIVWKGLFLRQGSTGGIIL